MVYHVPSTSISIKILPWLFFEENCNDLFKEHYEEIALNKSVMKLLPNWERYHALEQSGLLICLGAFRGEECIGYSINFFTNHMHYREMFYVQNDLLFVAEEHRKTRVGLDLIRETEKQAFARGAEMMLWHAKENTSLNTLMSRLGYKVQDIIYSKVL